MNRLPSLGPRGEGWVAIQMVLLGAIALAGLAGPRWGGGPSLPLSLVGFALVAAGFGLAVLGVGGLRRALTPFPRPAPDAVLVTSGVYGRVRHPIYGGLIVAALGWSLVTASWLALVLSIALLGFFEIKSRREELWLVERFEDYPGYRAKTRRFIPWIG